MDTIKIKLGATQIAALQMYVLESVHDEIESDMLRAAFTDGAKKALVMPSMCAAALAAHVTDASNSADEDGDRAYSAALAKVASKLYRAA